MSEIGSKRMLFARKMLSDSGMEMFKYHMRLAAYRLGQKSGNVPDLIDYCTEHAFREMGLDLSFGNFGKEVESASMCDNTEYEEVMAAQRIMEEE